MHDILPAEIGGWQHVESVYRAVLNQFCYQEIRFPVLEETQLFKRSVGEVTDIVEKEMYTFNDRNDLSVTLRPEGTAGCVRAAEQHGLLYNQVQKLFYSGAMFRYERPQKGRTRQFHQLGVEAFGVSGTDIELELILICAKLFKELGIEQGLSLEINSIGDSEARSAFGEALVSYLEQHRQGLDEDSQRRLAKNPLRILDSKNEKTRTILENAPELKAYLSDESLDRYRKLKDGLESAGVEFRENKALVRGLDYYNDLVFEWTSEHLGAQATVCAGGRYDSLVQTLGGKATPAAGFAIGMERLLLLLETLGKLPVDQALCDIFVVYVGESAELAALQLCEKIRNTSPEKRIYLNCGGAGLKSQLKKADKSGATHALILGEEELSAGTVQINYLREKRENQSLDEQALLAFISSL